MSKMIISPAVVFNFFKILFCLVRRGVKGQKKKKNGPEWPNIAGCTLNLRNHTSYDTSYHTTIRHLWCTCVK